jgi:hypothetical protein
VPGRVCRLRFGQRLAGFIKKLRNIEDHPNEESGIILPSSGVQVDAEHWRHRAMVQEVSVESEWEDAQLANEPIARVVTVLIKIRQRLVPSLGENGLDVKISVGLSATVKIQDRILAFPFPPAGTLVFQRDLSVNRRALNCGGECICSHGRCQDVSLAKASPRV